MSDLPPHPDTKLSDEDLIMKAVRSLSTVLDKVARGMEPGRACTPLRRTIRLLKQRPLTEDLLPRAEFVIQAGEMALKVLR